MDKELDLKEKLKKELRTQHNMSIFIFQLIANTLVSITLATLLVYLISAKIDGNKILFFLNATFIIFIAINLYFPSGLKYVWGMLKRTKYREDNDKKEESKRTHNMSIFIFQLIANYLVSITLATLLVYLISAKIDGNKIFFFLTLLLLYSLL